MKFATAKLHIYEITFITLQGKFMLMRPRTIVFFLFVLLLPACIEAKKPKPAVVRLETTMGIMRVELSDDTPHHRDNFLRLAREGRLDSTLFHRVIKNFMIQGGDPQSLVKTHDSIDYTLPAEFRLPWLFHVRGALAAAREGDDVNPEMRSSGSQFYIVYGQSWSENALGKVRGMLDEKGIEMNREMWDAYLQHGGSPHLDGTYTVFGHIIEGMKVLKQIQAVATDGNDRPVEPVILLRAVVE